MANNGKIVFRVVNGEKERLCSGKCRLWLPLAQFHGGPNTKKSKCKGCWSIDYFCQKQEKLKAQYNSGDTKIDICKCGSFYVNEAPRGKDRSEMRVSCRTCAMKKNELVYQRRLGEIGMATQIASLQLINKELEGEVFRLRRLVSETRKEYSLPRDDIARAAHPLRPFAFQ